MVTEQSLHKQLTHIGFKTFGWGRGEVRELPHIILPEEKILECVNGIYEGGFALLLATDVRVLLVDKKPFNHLTVEDVRFDQINQIDYSHRIFGANIRISTGPKILNFRSYNQPRLRKLIGHVQHSMAEVKKKQSDHEEGQNQRLEQINQQLQNYLMVQHQHQEELRQHLLLMSQNQGGIAPPTLAQLPQAARPSPELSDYLLAQNLMAHYQQQTGQAADQSAAGLTALAAPPSASVSSPAPQPQTAAVSTPYASPATGTTSPPQPAANDAPAEDSPATAHDLYAEGLKEIFGQRQAPAPGKARPDDQAADSTSVAAANHSADQDQDNAVRQAMDNLYRPHDPKHDVNPLRVAYSKLPALLRARKFGRRPRPAGEAA